MPRVCSLLLSLCLWQMSFAQTARYALVIGNADYPYASLGQAPVNDANAMRDALILAGFQVDHYTNLDQGKLSSAITAFGRKIKDSKGVAVFYYSGHGVQHRNTNYLVPIGAEMSDEDDIEGLCVPINRISSRMLNAGTATNIIILDACRSFPMSRGTKNLTQGLAKEDYAAPELMIAFATAPGSTAAVRGENGMSLYTSQLIKHLKTPGLVLETVLKNTRRDVLSKSNNQQRPDEYGNLTSDFYFFPPDSKPAPENTVPPQQEKPTGRTTDPAPVQTPPGTDRDLDGVPDATDPCPDDYGTANGCPDADDDGVPDRSDKCPYLAGEKRWQGCPDSDGDGIPDHEDLCPLEKGEAAHKGCPPPDRDRDGVPDALDLCPDQPGLKTLSGCPDSDGDGVADKSDKCPDKPGLPRFQGCPDSDGDGIPDHEDLCPTVKGSAANKGCPDLSALGFRPDDFVRVTGGSFDMGSNDYGDEKPIHRVNVPTFELAKYELTNAQFCIFLNDITSEISISSNGDEVSYKGKVIFDLFCGDKKGGCSGFTENIDYSGGTRPGGRFSPAPSFENHPVVLVSWYGAKAYCAWLSQRTGQTYRLPSEAEWEFAAKGGHATKGYRYSGSDNVDEVAWYTSNAGGKSRPVGQKKANELGLFDMSGNVWEWCEDTWHENYQGAPTDGSAWTTSGDQERAVLRGGSWNNYVNDCRSAFRLRYYRTDRTYYYGLRVARAAGER